MVLIPKTYVERFVAVNPGDVVLFGCAASFDTETATAIGNQLMRSFGIVAMFTATVADVADLTDAERRDCVELARGLVRQDDGPTA